MNRVKVAKVDHCFIEFDNGVVLSSHHEQECCESHYLSFSDLSLDDFDGLEFDLTSDSFFERVVDYGIRLIPVNGHPVSVPGYGSNNGYYSCGMDLVLRHSNGLHVTFDISECQDEREERNG